VPKSYSDTVLGDSPNVFLKLNEASGTNCADSTANAQNGTASSATRNVSTGFSGLPIGLTLSGASGSNVRIANNALEQVHKPVTFEIWFNYAGNSVPANSAIMSQGVTSTNEGWVVYLQTGKNILVADANTGATAVTTAASSVTLQAWHYLVFTRDSLNNNTVYLDGVQSATNNASPGTANNTEPFSLGATTTGGTDGSNFNGTLAAFALYPAALTSTQVSNHYAARNTAVTTSAATKQNPPPSIVGRIPGGPKQHRPGPKPPPQTPVLPGRLVEGVPRKTSGA
jgi:hypothetical protein